MPDTDLTVSYTHPADLDEMVEVMNRAFGDYVVPMHMSGAGLRALLERDNVDLGASYLARPAGGGPALGLALTALREAGPETRIRVAAMGVAPEGRGRGVARALLARQMAEGRARGCAEIVLECFAHNTRALPLYESSGFRVRRRLGSYTAAADELRLPPPGAVRLVPATAAALPALARACQVDRPSWQLEPDVLAFAGPMTQSYAIHAGADLTPVGYIVFGVAPGATEARLAHIGVLPAQQRQGYASAALRAWLTANLSIRTLSIPPILPDDMTSVRGWLAAVGFQPGPLVQVEMAAPLIADPKRLSTREMLDRFDS